MFKPGDVVRGKMSGSLYHIDAVTEHHVCYTRLTYGNGCRSKARGTVGARYWKVVKVGQNYKVKS